MKIAILGVILGAGLVFSPVAQAGERVGDGLMGAAAGAIVGGPVGAVAGGAIGYTAGPHISRRVFTGITAITRGTRVTGITETQKPGREAGLSR